MLIRWLTAILCVLSLSALVVGCIPDIELSSRGIQGRWQVISSHGMSVPHSFFWFTLDYIEFLADGTILGLMQWPPGESNELRLNKTASYELTGENEISFSGSCRHRDPCTGIYTATVDGNMLYIFDTEGHLELQRVGPLSEDLPPAANGPSPTATPSRTQ